MERATFFATAERLAEQWSGPLGHRVIPEIMSKPPAEAAALAAAVAFNLSDAFDFAGQFRRALIERALALPQEDPEPDPGSDNPNCIHEWACTGESYGGDELGEGRSYCMLCGADGDA